MGNAVRAEGEEKCDLPCYLDCCGDEGLFSSRTGAGGKVCCEFRVGDEVLHALVRDGDLHSGAGLAPDPDVIVATTSEIFRRFESGEDPAGLEKTGK